MNLMDKKLVRFSNIVFIKGINRSAIYDLQRETLNLIPNDLYDFVFDNEFLTYEQIVEKYDGENLKIIDGYLNFLKSKEYVFWSSYPELFPKLSEQWFDPFSINNAIIDVSKNLELKLVLEAIDKIGSKNVEFRMFDSDDIENQIESIINYFNRKKSICSFIGFVFPFKSDMIFDTLYSFLENNPRIGYYLITSSPHKKFYSPLRGKTGYVFMSDETLSEQSCGLISLKGFAINIKMYTESQHHNTCLNRKISIDKDGNIKNCPSMPQSFGNIKDTTLEQALNHPDFKKYWNVNKDMIAVCKDCEFRHICTDCRAYTERTHFEEDIDLSKPLKCGYNPYTNEWAEWSTNPLKQKAIEFYGMQDLVKKDA